MDTVEVLHRWSQIAGKIRMANTPWVNHSWSVPLYVSARGLTTSLVPYGDEAFELTFDLLRSELVIDASTGERGRVPLETGTVAEFYREVHDVMRSIGMGVEISPFPSELPGAVPLDVDTAHRSYDPEHAAALWRALLRAHHGLTLFRTGFTGKASPVHFFWGGFDMATSRFSGRPAPRHPGGIARLPDDVTREAYSHELTSAGFWPGNRTFPDPVFYAYAYPTPPGYAAATVEPLAATWVAELGEFVLPYAEVASSADPHATLQRFLESTHRAAANLAGWSPSLDCVPPNGPDWWSTRPHDEAQPANGAPATDSSGEPVWSPVAATALPDRPTRARPTRYPDPNISTIDDPRR